jgi:putative transposase
MSVTFPPGPGATALRHGRHSRSGQIYLITFTTYHRRRYFSEFDRAHCAAKALHAFHRDGPTDVLAWVLMPDHWHGLVRLGETDDLSQWIGQLKGASSFQLRSAEPGIGRVWATGFHDHALRREADLLECARYIVLNPVRAGLAARVGDYPFWDAVWLCDSDGWENHCG